MHIVGVILNSAMNSVCKSINIVPYEDFLGTAVNYTYVALALQLDNNSFLFIDICKLLAEQPMILIEESNEVPVTSWETLEQYLNQLDSDILKNCLTRTIVPRMFQIEENKWILCPFYSNIETQLRIVGVENAFGLDVALSNIDDPYTRTGGVESWDIQDMVITNRGRTDIDFDNTVPIINGSVFYPEIWTNPETNNKELFAIQAGRWIVHSNWNNSKVRTVKHNRIPNGLRYDTLTDLYRGKEKPMSHAGSYNKGIVLVDFSSIGTIDTYKLSDCRNGRVYGIEEVDTEVTEYSPRVNPNKAWLKGVIKTHDVSYYTITFSLPEGAETGIPIVCIGGRLFFTTDESKLSIQTFENESVITLTVEKHLLNDILMSNKQWFGKQIPGTMQLEIDPKSTLDELFNDTAYGRGTPEDVYRYLNEDLSTPFVIILHANKKVVTTRTQPKMELGPDKLLFPPDVGGLLFNKKTHEIIDYTRIPYASGTLVEYTLQRPLRAIDNRDPHRLTKPQLGFEWNDFTGREKYVKFNIYEELRSLNNFELIDFAYMEV